MPTLAVLENFLLDYPGCIIIVSHDRYFMDKLVDHLLVFEGEGVVKDYPGNYSLFRIEQQQKESNKKENQKSEPIAPKTIETPVVKQKISFKDKREFELLEKEIPQLEQEKKDLENLLGSGNLDFEAITKNSNRIGEIQALLEEKEMRWLELSEML